MTLTLRLLFGKDMIEMGLSALVAALARLAEALGRAPVGFHLRHVVFLLALLRTAKMRPLQAGSAVPVVKPLGCYSLFLMLVG